MGSLSTLPALDVKTPQQPDLLQQFSQLQQLKGNQQAMQQRAALAPLQQQAAEQNVQTGQLDIQQKQQQLKNQQALTQAYQTWDGRSYEDLAHLALKAGATGDAIQAIQQHGLALRKTASDIAESDAKTGSDNATTLGKQLDQAAGALQGVLSAPPEQQGQALIATAQQLAQQKRPDGTPLLDAQHLQMAEQLAQQGPQAIATQVPIFAKSLTALSAQLEAAQKSAATAQDVAKTGQANAETAFYAKNGGAPGVPTEAVQQADWLSKNPGKGPSDYVAWKAKQSPMALVMGNMLGPNNNGQGNPALDFAANQYRMSGQMPGDMSRSPGTAAAIIGRAAQLDAAAGGSGIAGNKAILSTYKDALDGLQKNFSAVSAFEDTANRNISMLENLAQKIPDLGAKFANTPVRMLSGNLIGTENMAAFKTALAPVQAEAAKILNSANLQGQLSDSSRHELQEIVDGNLSYKPLVASLNVLQQDFKNRHDAYQLGITDLQNKIKNAGSESQTQAAPARPAGVPTNATWNAQGNGGKGSWVAP